MFASLTKQGYASAPKAILLPHPLPLIPPPYPLPYMGGELADAIGITY